MRETLSILIPTYNTDCNQLVTTLHAQATSLPSLTFEIIVADDGSTDTTCIEGLKRLKLIGNVCLISNRQNIGRAAIRNVLARKAQYTSLLFIDSDMKVANPDFLYTYLNTEGDVIYGSYIPPSSPQCLPSNLRYKYETNASPRQTAEQRRLHPHRDFHTSNFLVEKDVIVRHPFDERFRFYGYEDVFWGKQMKKHGILIQHIDNPVVFSDFEDNAHFLDKTEEGLRTLYHFAEDLEGYSILLDFTRRHQLFCRIFKHWHSLFGKLERTMLLNNISSLSLFKLYKLGYFTSLS